MSNLRVLVIGPEPGELESLAASISTRDHATEWTRATDCPAAVALLERDAIGPDLVVLCEDRPGRWTESSLTALRLAAPLVPLVRLSGSWCEGQMRSGSPPSGCPSIAWQNWPRQGPRDWSPGHAKVSRLWAHPTTATPEERLLAALESRQREELPGAGAGRAAPVVAICSPSAAASGALEVTCRAAGLPTVTLPTTTLLPGERRVVHGAQAIVWDTEPRLLHDAKRIAELRALAPEARLIALTGFPRSEDIAAALRAGVAAVLSKPFLVNDLLDEIALSAAARS